MTPLSSSHESTRWRSIRVAFGRFAKWNATFIFPFVVSLLLSLVFAVPEQFLELYRIMAGDVIFAIREGGKKHIWLSALRASFANFSPLFAALTLLSVALAFSARIVEVLGRSPRRPSAPIWQALYTYMPLVIGTLPIIGCLVGVLSARSVSAQGNISEQAAQLLTLGDESLSRLHTTYIALSRDTDFVLIIVAVLLAVATSVFASVGYVLYRRTNVAKRLYEQAKSPFPVAILTACIVIVITILLYFPVQLPQSIGVFGVIAAFGATLTIFGACLIVHSRQLGFPIIGALVIWAISLTLLDFNDNHQLTYKGADGKEAFPNKSQVSSLPPLPEVESEFIDWLKNRHGITFSASPGGASMGAWKTDNGKRFPVYIVAAQGGGIYAAAQASIFLAQTAAMCEQFPQHLFAISSVSGGSVGSALFNAALTQFGSKKAECLAWETITDTSKNPFPAASYRALKATHEMALDDWLSPLMGAALFPDFAQRFLPIPRPSLSRARALEAAIARSWADYFLEDGNGRNPLEQGIAASWDPKGIRPALLFNTTETASGRRRVVAPFQFAVPDDIDLRFLPLSRELDVSLATAAVASARFPYLTPAAWFWPLRGLGADAKPTNSDQKRVRIVDGGYFENSGVATATDLVARLDEIVQKHDLPVEIHMIVLTYGRYPERKFYAFGEFLAPIRSLLNTRASRTLSTIALADREMDTIEGARPVRRLQRVTLSDFYTPLPLGWRLSNIGVLQIRLGMSRIPYCYPDKAFVQAAGTPALGDGNCVARLIWHQLRGDDIARAREEACQQAKQRSAKHGGNFSC